MLLSPNVFRAEVSHQTQEPSFEFLPAEPGIRPSASWRSELLQISDPFEVPFLRRREDPLSQPPYLVFDLPPSDGIPSEVQALRSVHHTGAGRHGWCRCL